MGRQALAARLPIRFGVEVLQPEADDEKVVVVATEIVTDEGTFYRIVNDPLLPATREVLDNLSFQHLDGTTFAIDPDTGLYDPARIIWEFPCSVWPGIWWTYDVEAGGPVYPKNVYAESDIFLLENGR